MSTSRIYLVTNKLSPSDRTQLLQNVSQLGARILSNSVQVIHWNDDEDTLLRILSDGVIMWEHINLIAAVGGRGLPLRQFAAITGETDSTRESAPLLARE